MAVNNGCDLNCGDLYVYLEQAVAEGKLSEEKIDESLTRLYVTRMRLGMFDAEDQVPYNKVGYDVVDSAEMKALNLKVADSIMTLLKNDGTLPLAGGLEADAGGRALASGAARRVAVVGPLADDGARLRLCIGAYPAPRTLGYRREQDKAKALVRCLRSAMERGGYAMVASHDPTIISIAQELARRNDIEPDGYEHQMFYGVRPLEQRRLVDIGHRCRTYVPFGPAWYEYLTAQISARPRAAYNYLRALGDKR